MPNVTCKPNRLVAALIYDGLCEFEFGIAAEVFGLERPEMGDDWYRFVTCSEKPGRLSTNSGLRVEAERDLSALMEAGTIVIPGWRCDDSAPTPVLRAALLAARERGARFVTICSGAFLLAAAGLLAGRRATTHWRYTERLASAHPDIEIDANVLYIDDGNILTSAGSAAGIDLLLHLVRKDFGPEAANSVARRMVVAPHRSGGQAQFVERPVPRHPGSQLAAVLDAVRHRPDKVWTIASMARIAAMSERTYVRRFREATGLSPGAWVIEQRVAVARALLETSDLPIDAIAAQSGMGSAANLRLHFRGHVAISPTAYRERFRREPELHRERTGSVADAYEDERTSRSRGAGCD
jgi:AraC family transcriptional regulator, transcriptional activator FtrA